MADTHHVHEETGSSWGFFGGIIILLLVLFFLFFYGFPLLRNQSTPQQPQPPQINVPDEFDVNINQ